MKHFTLFVFSILMSAFLNAAELDWLHDYEKALQDAKRYNKDIYLFIGADKCRFCDRFKEIALADQGIMQRLKNEYILVYLSRDRHHVPKQFKTKGVPWHYFINSHGKIFHSTWGDREVAGFYDVLDEAELNKL